MEKLSQILGDKAFTQNIADIEPWLTDWRGRYTGTTLALLSPATTQQVSEIVKICAEHKLPIVPQGGNSGMVGGATPDKSGRSVLLSLRRMNKFISADPQSGAIKCEAGVILQHLHEHAEKIGRRFPLTLGGKGSATIGGLISTNAGGTQVLRHGTMRALVDGIEFVLPDGSIFNGMAPLKKDNRGYDIRHLILGAEGSLGIVTGATLRTVPALIDRCVLWCGTDSTQKAYDLLMMIDAMAGPQLEGFEIMPQSAISAVMDHIPAMKSPLDGEYPWHILIEFVRDQSDMTSPNDLGEKIFEKAFDAGLISNATLSQNEQHVLDFWTIRDSISEAERKKGPAVQHDISVPVVDMPRFIDQAGAAVQQKFAGCLPLSFGHLGDGNVHFHVKAPPGVDAESWYNGDAHAISDFVYDMVEEFGGSISAEHGIGQVKSDCLRRLSSPARMTMLRAIKTAIDPDNIMNPGKLIS
ncbi:hydroxyacid dehydrogenase [Sphingorhabdus lutea]|uniref:Hydroxyacid dehydrogenase n=2 Tax=Sphingorhabdus lutea TaxID=1913578 RepID=A0A1L3JEN5_9SPHN|nr:hydroxyacid dehydrogenase [Sphingorhabdus lutea]